MVCNKSTLDCMQPISITGQNSFHHIHAGHHLSNHRTFFFFLTSTCLGAEQGPWYRVPIKNIHREFVFMFQPNRWLQTSAHCWWHILRLKEKLGQAIIQGSTDPQRVFVPVIICLPQAACSMKEDLRSGKQQSQSWKFAPRIFIKQGSSHNTRMF